MKNNLIILSFFSILILSGCNYKIVKNTEESNVDIFQKKQECRSYQSDIEKKLNPEWSVFWNTLDEIFYSPTEDSCFYSYIINYITRDGRNLEEKMGKEYVIVDYLTNETILSGNSLINPDIVTLFYLRKAELKKFK